MGVHNLDRIFRPRRVAVIGASDRVGSVGASVMRNLAEALPGVRMPPAWRVKTMAYSLQASVNSAPATGIELDRRAKPKPLESSLPHETRLPRWRAASSSAPST